jgi:hypothetical protein
VLEEIVNESQNNVETHTKHELALLIGREYSNGRKCRFLSIIYVETKFSGSY